MTRIVVGVSGSQVSHTALRWAVAEADLRQAEVVAVRAWRPVGESVAPYASALGRPSEEEQLAAAEGELTAVVEATTGPMPPAKVHLLVVRDHAACALIEQAADADLLVLGGQSSMSPGAQTPGAVARACLSASPCPVVLVSGRCYATTLAGATMRSSMV